MKVQIKVDTGKLNRTKDALKRLPTDFDRDQVMMRVFRKAARPLISRGQTEAQLAAPNVARGFSWGARKSRDGTVMRVGVVNKSGTSGRLAFLFDHGTSDRYTDAGAYRGSIRKTDFWAKAIAATEQQVVNLVDANVDKEIDAYLKKYNL